MNNQKTIFSILGFVLALILFSGSLKVTSEALKSPEFTYSANNPDKDGKTDLTIALLSPTYSDISSQGEPFKSFQKSLEAEILEALTEKGYSVRGPFENRDEMVFSDKEACHLALKIKIEPELAKATGSWKQVKTTDGRIGVGFKKGTVNVYGKINLTAMEPISGEKMWAKSVSIPQQTTREFSSSKVFLGNSNASEAKVLAELAGAGDANVSNPLTEVLEKSFDDIMTKVWRHLDPAEFMRLKPEIEKLKNK